MRIRPGADPRAVLVLVAESAMEARLRRWPPLARCVFTDVDGCGAAARSGPLADVLVAKETFNPRSLEAAQRSWEHVQRHASDHMAIHGPDPHP